jgi:cellulose synthase (UDP-forming)
MYVQRWMCHPGSERGFHWRGMILKFATWPVFTLGFLLGLVNAEIPYIPTAKKAVTGYFTPYARPLIIQSALFLIALVIILIRRLFFIPEDELIFTAERTWAMIGFAFIAFLLTLGGIYAAYEAKHMKEEDPWNSSQPGEIRNNENEIQGNSIGT